MMENEIWKDVEGFKQKCQVSNYGGFRKKEKNGEWWYPTIRTNSWGYSRVFIDHKWRILSRIIAETFIPNPENKPCVDHIDTNRQNNHVSNLRWCTGKENMRNPISMENARIAQEKRWNSKNVKVYALTQSGEMKYLALFTSTKGASRYPGVKFETIETHIKSGKPHKGYIFQRPKENE